MPEENGEVGVRIMKTLLTFIKHVPGFFRLYRDWGYTPNDYEFILDQYSEVLCDITGNRMSKHLYYAKDILSVVQEHYCDNCDYITRISE